MRVIKVLTDATSKDEALWESVKKFYGVLTERFKAVQKVEWYYLTDAGMSVFDIYVAKCKKSVWKEILKTIKEAKKYFVVEYRVVSTRDS